MDSVTPRIFLSRLFLNLRSRQVMSEIAHPYEMHRTLMRAFPNVADDARSRAREVHGVLFRADVDDIGISVRLLVQSCVEANWAFLDALDDYLCVDRDGPKWEQKEVTSCYRYIRSGEVLSFRLRANPTKRIARRADAMRGKRVELGREKDQLAWLIRKGHERGAGILGGFELVMQGMLDEKGGERVVPRVRVRSEGKLCGRKRGATGGGSMTHLAVVFEGLLRVTEADSFRETLIHGVGSGKAFGFGLLSVARVETTDTVSTL